MTKNGINGNGPTKTTKNKNLPPKKTLRKKNILHLHYPHNLLIGILLKCFTYDAI